jgi:hypothetical protein
MDLGRVIATVVMVVGIGFGSVLIGAVAQRFVIPEVRAEGEEVEREVEAPEEELLGELRDVSARLRRIGGSDRAAGTVTRRLSAERTRRRKAELCFRGRRPPGPLMGMLLLKRDGRRPLAERVTGARPRSAPQRACRPINEAPPTVGAEKGAPMRRLIAALAAAASLVAFAPTASAEASYDRSTFGSGLSASYRTSCIFCIRRPGRVHVRGHWRSGS